jgi:2-methylfumaryl-CoA hydratase
MPFQAFLLQSRDAIAAMRQKRTEKGGQMSDKTSTGNFFEDFSIGQVLNHATPRTVTTGDAALYAALYGSRFAVQSDDSFARAIGYDRSPIDDLLVFHIVFGKTVPDISLNAVANLGYADCRFLHPVFPGDSLTATSRVIGLRENSNRKTGVVYVRSTGHNQHGGTVLDYTRWVMVRKRDEAAKLPEGEVPQLAARVDPATLGGAVPHLTPEAYSTVLSGSAARWGDYAVGERIDHVDGMTIEEAEHQMATRLYQNTARVHFNQHTEGQGRFGRRLVYGGHIISLARALSFNGLANAFHIAAINGGRHVAPAFAGVTVYAWSEVLETAALAGREDVGALRIRTIGLKDRNATGFPLMADENTPEEGVILDLDYWVVMPR